MEDTQISIEETIAGYVEFQECVEDILEEMEEDEYFSEMSADSYDKKKGYLRESLKEVSRLHTLLFDQHVRLIDEVSKNCPSLIKKNHLDSSGSSSKRESSDSCSEPEVLHEMISNLEELKMSDKLETETTKEELKASNETEISQLKSAYEKKEKIWNDVTGKLKNDLKEKCELVDELSMKMDRKDKLLDILWAQKESRDILIHQLKTKLNSVKFDNIQKPIDEMKLKNVELEKDLDKGTG